MRDAFSLRLNWEIQLSAGKRWTNKPAMLRARRVHFQKYPVGAVAPLRRQANARVIFSALLRAGIEPNPGHDEEQFDVVAGVARRTGLGRVTNPGP